MRAWMLRRSGGPDVLSLEEVPTPGPAAGEVRVAVEAIGINYAESLSRRGLYGWAPRRPYIPGMEVAGTVEAVGDGVDPGRVGERVLCGMQHGGYAERVIVPSARALSAVPGFSVEECAAFGVNFLTAWVALVELGRLRPTDRVGITAAAGGVGTAAVQIARGHGCRVLGMAGSDDKLERVRALGAEATVNYRRPDFRARLADATRGDGLDVVLETVGGDVFEACLDALAPFGRVAVAGYASLDYRWWNPVSWWRAWRGMPRLSLTRSLERSIGMLATHVGYLLPDAARLTSLWNDLRTFADAHGLRPVVGATFPFEQLPEAHRLIESRESVGKIVVRVGAPRDR